MVNQEHPEGGAPQGESQQAPAAAPVFTGAARRRFTRVGVAAVGAVLTLKSQPGMAANAYACSFASPSVAGSFNINHSRAPKIGYCTAKSHGWWKNHTGSWPASPFTANTNMANETFGKAFPPGGDARYGPSSKYYNAKLGDVIGWSGNADMAQEMPRHIIAAYLNAMTNRTNPYLTTMKLREIWAGYVSGGFNPAGRVWTTKELVNYLLGTWGDTKYP